jgi:hypothetical protein
MNRLRPLEHWDRGFESYSRHGCLCVRLFYMFVLSCVQVAALRRADLPSNECYRLCIGLRNRKSGQGPKGCTAIQREREFSFLLACNPQNKLHTQFCQKQTFFFWLSGWKNWGLPYVRASLQFVINRSFSRAARWVSRGQGCWSWVQAREHEILFGA